MVHKALWFGSSRAPSGDPARDGWAADPGVEMASPRRRPQQFIELPVPREPGPVFGSTCGPAFCSAFFGVEGSRATVWDLEIKPCDFPPMQWDHSATTKTYPCTITIALPGGNPTVQSKVDFSLVRLDRRDGTSLQSASAEEGTPATSFEPVTPGVLNRHEGLIEGG